MSTYWDKLIHQQVGGGADELVSAEVSVAPNAWTTVVSVTPDEDFTVMGFNGDVAALLSTNYRLRLISGTDAAPTPLVQEVLATVQMSWISLRADFVAGTRVAVQILHAEAVATNCRATINYTH